MRIRVWGGDRGQAGPSAARKAFDPRDRSTWGKGGKAPLLVFDLGWGGTHGLVFAGSGSYKTVSTCVPTLLTYRGPTVTLDPSSELAPMLTPARIAMAAASSASIRRAATAPSTPSTGSTPPPL